MEGVDNMKRIKTYRKGADFERDIVNEAREKGLISFRSAGSHSPIDVCIIDPKRHTIRFIQAKAGKKPTSALIRLRNDLGRWDGEYLVSFGVVEK